MRRIVLILITLMITETGGIGLAQAEPTLVHNVQGYHILPEQGLSRFSVLVFDNGKVLESGDNALLEKYPQAEKIDGQGNTLLPGLTDAHGHILELGENLLKVDVRGSQSAAQAAQQVAEFATAHPQQDWVTGHGWNQVLWPDKNYPTAAQLDKTISDSPVFLTRVDVHAAWVNSKALELAGIDKNTPDPQGGQILRDDNGQPTGVLIDNAMGLVSTLLPEQTEQSLNLALNTASEHLLSLGITSVHDAGITQQQAEFYRQQDKAGELSLRIYAMLAASDPQLAQMLEQGPFSSQDDMLVIRSVKGFGDGALGSRGAAMLAPYSDQPHHHGLMVTAEEKLPALFEQVLGHGFQFNFHAIGDKANRLALDNFEQAYKNVGGKALRHRIEHAQVVTLEDIPRFKQLNIIASMQPVHATSDMNMAGDRIGTERLKGAYAWQRFLQQGTVLAAGSDFPVELVNPFHGLHAAVTRQNHKGEPLDGWLPSQRMTLEQALRAFTLDAAYAAHQEQVLGNLTEGKWADFILVDQDIFEVPPERLWQTRALQTWVAGERQD
ncbi:amidohydrolase [Lacimicrobium alkaliphilum]|uniref:Amidohydrolase n=1 Tax=Lacimicrobium alkaliphilum TaxID=1526571 RepID=A0ABQ1QX10_9ALTE|nr:amidohydrolase [Lacimicrobium alkaliphilum]GGD48131.1 amidohydrolase [Lacimicrobium alkaliphilum]